jgi:hypothetical protein
VPVQQFPRPLKGWLVDPALGSLDPQIAVSASHVVVTTSSLIAFYSRTGSLLKLFSAASFFGPLKADINAHLNIPTDLVAKYSVDEFYDVRALYDRYRDRFWVGALARNSGAKYGNAVDQTYRRTKFVLAVSDDADPSARGRSGGGMQSLMTVRATTRHILQGLSPARDPSFARDTARTIRASASQITTSLKPAGRIRTPW